MRRHRTSLAALTVAAVALLVVPLAVADAPAVSITSGPSGVVDTDGATFDFSVDDPAATVECSLDGGGFSGCSSGVSYSGLGDGSHTFVARATNADAETGSDSRSWEVDTTGPTLSLSNVVRDVDDDPAPVTVTYTAGASDPHEPVALTCLPVSPSDFPYGVTTVNCDATDGLGNSSSGSFTVTVQDTTDPAVTVPGNQTVNINAAATAVVTWAGVSSNEGTPTCSPASGSSFPLGTTTVTCSATDTSGNTGSASFTVTVQDTTDPAVTVPGNQTVNVNAAATAVVTWAGVSSNEGTPTCGPASGSSFPLGTTTVTCSATDTSGNTGSASFTVTVQDTTDPTVAITSGPTGTVASATATFSFTTNEGSLSCSLDSGGFSPCSSPISFGGLADGVHTFRARAGDLAGNTTTVTRSWTIDLTPPTITVPGTTTVEANGPAGSTVAYIVTASDGGIVLLPGAVGCSPPPGALFPLGTTPVTCSAADALGNAGAATFDVVVRDSTAPTLTVADITVAATTAEGIRRDDKAMAAYLRSLTATDLVSSSLTVITNAPDLFPVGNTPLAVSARDDAGNASARTVTVTVLPLGQAAPPPPDLTPPADVTGVRATAGDRRVALRWVPPRSDVAAIEVTMTVAGTEGAGRVVYRGLRGAATVAGLRNDVQHRFLLIAVDAAGNRSRGVVALATPRSILLASPKPGARVVLPPLLRWAPVPGASYFNLQLYRGKVKVLSAWPVAARLQLRKAWTYDRVRRTLAPGTYSWFVWPGLGSRAEARYGPLLGKSTFTVVKAPT